MRIVVDSPDVLFPALVVLEAVAIDLPIGNAVDRIGVRFLIGFLQPTPNEILDVILNGVDFCLRGIEDVFSRDVGRFAQNGVVGSDRVRLQAVEVVRTTEDLVLHVPLRKKGVVPLARILVLLVRYEKRSPLLVQGFQRFGDEKFKREIAALAIVKFQKILPQAGKPNLVDLHILPSLSGRLDFRLVKILRHNRADFRPGFHASRLRTDALEHKPFEVLLRYFLRFYDRPNGSSRRFDGARHQHAGDDLAFLEHLSHAGVILRPAEPEPVDFGVPGMSMGRKKDVGVWQTPGSAFRAKLFSACRGVDVGRVAAGEA